MFEFWPAQGCQGLGFSVYWVLWCSVHRDLLLWGWLLSSSHLGGRSCTFPSTSWQHSLGHGTGVLLSPTVGGPGLSAHPLVVIIGELSGGAWDCWQGCAFVLSCTKSLTPTVIFISSNSVVSPKWTR